MTRPARADTSGSSMRRGRGRSTTNSSATRPGRLVQHDDPVGQAGRLPHVVGDEEHRAAGVAPDALELVVHDVAGHGVEGAEGLVHEQDVALLGQRAGQGHALAHAARELVGLAILEPAQLHQAEQLGGPLAALGLADAAEAQGQLDVAAHGQPGEERRRPGTSCAGRPVRCTSPAVALSRPATRLSRVVLPQPDAPTRQTNSPGRHIEGDVVEGHDGRRPAAEHLGDTVERHRRLPCRGQARWGLGEGRGAHAEGLRSGGLLPLSIEELVKGAGKGQSAN